MQTDAADSKPVADFRYWSSMRLVTAICNIVISGWHSPLHIKTSKLTRCSPAGLIHIQLAFGITR